MCLDGLTAALPIVSPSLCLLSRFLANNGNGNLFLDGYFVHQHQCYPAFVEMESSECESADDMDAEQLATVHCTSAQQSGGGTCLLRRKPIDWLRNACRRNATEWRKPLKSVLHGSRAICHSAQGVAIKLAQL